ncbi:hypothetical protein [Paeniglutamicibacter sp.]|uniref:hypothetical protein n=1 Tax=Paeniglutamicibacter sp. TaxID=1934391 RepID=UPI0039891C1D
MVAELRSTLGEQAENIPPRVLEQLEGIIQTAVHTIDNAAEIVAIGLPDFEPEPVEPVVAGLAVAESVAAEPAPASSNPAVDHFSHGAYAAANRQLKAKQLARWLWDRNINGEQVLGFTNKWRNKIARAAGVNPPSTLETWTVAAELMERMAQLDGSGLPTDASGRHHLDEHEQWATEH